eukprot:2530498-Pyramimonas_sp.AAC.1
MSAKQPLWCNLGAIHAMQPMCAADVIQAIRYNTCCTKYSATYAVQPIWCNLCCPIHVVQSKFRNTCGAIHLVQTMWCNIGCAIYVERHILCNQCGAISGVQYMWNNPCCVIQVVHFMLYSLNICTNKCCAPAWSNISGAIYVMQAVLCELCCASYVVVLSYVVQNRWNNLDGASYVVQSMLYNLGCAID